MITMTKGVKKMRSDIKVPMKQGLLFCIYLTHKDKVCGGTANQVKLIPIAKVHALLGHHNKETTRKTAKALGWAISRGSMKPCKACTISKAKQKNVLKMQDENKNATEANKQ